MSANKQKPLFYKFLVTLPIITIVFWLLSTFITGRHLHKIVLDDFKTSNQRIIKSIARQSANNLAYYDYFELIRTTHDFFNDEYMSYLAIYTPDIKPVAIYPTQLKGEDFNFIEERLSEPKAQDYYEHFYERNGKELFYIQYSITDDQGNLLGYIVMGGTTKHLDALVQKQIISFIILGVVVLIIQMIAIIYVSHLITNPLRKVTRLMSVANEKDPDTLIDTALDLTPPRGASRETALFISVYQKLLRKIQEHIRHKKELALHAAIGRMASHLAHDVRTPLSVMNTFLNLKVDFEDNDIKQLHDAAKRSLEKLIAMVEDLVDYAKAREIQPQPTDIGPLIREVVGELSHLALPKKIAIDIHHQDKFIVNLDPHKLIRVLTNILMNAIQAIPLSETGGTITIEAHLKDQELLLSISDTGCGIAPEHLPYIFDSSFTFGKPRGSGLGLSYCRNVVDAHHGTIEVESQLQKGTKFTIRMPIAPTFHNTSAPTPFLNHEKVEKLITVPHAPFGKGSILIIDDDPKARHRLREIIIKLTGHEPVEMASGEELFHSSIDFSKVRIAISDYKFENSTLNGIDILELLKQKNIPTLCLCTSMYENASVRHAALKLGIAHIIPKPVQDDRVQKIIEKSAGMKK